MAFFQGIKAILDFIKEYFKSLLFIAFMIFLFSPQEEIIQNHNLAKINITGEIAIIDEVIEKLRKSYENDSIKGVLLVIDSGGGAVDKSVEISDIVRKIRAKKPVITYASGTLASGSYYSAIWSNKIIANRGSLVGSIGVIFSGINYKELAEKIGIDSQILKVGKYKESGTASRTWLPYEKAELEKVINDTYDMFISDVAEARHLDKNRSSEFADAHIFTARQSLKVGLIDSLGTILDAEYELEKLSKVENPIWEKESDLDKFIKKVSAEFIGNMSAIFDWKLR